MISALVILFLLFFNFSKSHSLLVDSIINFGHVPLFMVVTAMVLWILDWKPWPVTTEKNYIRAGIIASGLALLSEVLQHFTPDRSFQAGDIAEDLVGAATFLLVAYQYRRDLPAGTRWVLNGVAFLLLLSTIMPVLSAAEDELRARRDFPLLASFETCREMDRWKIEENNEWSTLHATHGIRSLRVDLAPNLYPGITLKYPRRNWQGFAALTFDAFLEGTQGLPLSIRIDDLAHNEEHTDRYNRTFALAPGPNRISISLDEVRQAPRGRPMEMGRISLLCLYAYRLKEQRTIYIDNFRLEHID